MFERFTDRARRTIVYAQDEARSHNHPYIGTEHLLLGIAHEGAGVAVRALAGLGLSLGDLRADIDGIIGRGQHEASGHVPFTPRAKKVLELSLREALQFGHSYIGTEHILLGLIREGGGVAAQVLTGRGVTLLRARQQVSLLLDSRESAPAQDASAVHEPEDLTTRLDSIRRRLGRIEERLRAG